VAPGTVSLNSLRDNLIILPDFLFGIISFTLLVMVIGIKNANNG
jgi:hypothetical protein